MRDALLIRPGRSLRGRFRVPGDKSISHRALLLGAIARGESRVEGFLPAADCLATLRCVQALGIRVERPTPSKLVVQGRGLWGLRAPAVPLNCAGSGTTMRLLCGLLAGQPFSAVLTGNDQLRRRPMERVVVPLQEMGAHIGASQGCAPLHIKGRATGKRLRGIDYHLPIPSAQVKSALLLAGLYAIGQTHLHEPAPSRDHTERMLKAMGADLEADDRIITLYPPPTNRQLEPLDISIPGDISSAAFFLVAGLLVPGSELVIEGVGVNPSRTGLLDVLKAMGAEIRVENTRLMGGEPGADLVVQPGELRGVEVKGTLIPRLIDELPVLAVAATQAQGLTIVRDAGELRVKESDRVAATVAGLRPLGASIEARPDGFIIEGPTPLRGSAVESHGDHRLAMALIIAGLLAEGETMVRETACIADSFPGFSELLARAGGNVQ